MHAVVITSVLTYKGSFHLIEHHSLKHHRGAGICWVFVLQPPAFLPAKFNRKHSRLETLKEKKQNFL